MVREAFLVNKRWHKCCKCKEKAADWRNIMTKEAWCDSCARKFHGRNPAALPFTFRPIGRRVTKGELARGIMRLEPR